jgi:hypothetical protein
MTTRTEIIELLLKRDVAVARALVVLNERQTRDEQHAEHTRYLNGQGFTPADARMGTSMATFFKKRGFLSPKQLAYWRKPNVRGVARIAKYAGQLLEIANEKAAKAMPFTNPVYQQVDVSNLLEEKMVLGEAYSYAVESGADESTLRIETRLIQIEEELEEARRCEYKMNRDIALAG